MACTLPNVLALRWALLEFFWKHGYVLAKDLSQLGDWLWIQMSDQTLMIFLFPHLIKGQHWEHYLFFSKSGFLWLFNEIRPTSQAYCPD